MKDSYSVRRIQGKIGKEFIIKYHYSHGCHNGPMTWGLFDNDELIGVCAFATPCSENVRASLFGKEYKDHVTELHRLVIIDDTPKNTESWFVSRAIKGLKKERPHVWAILSFSDSTQGHKGTVYQACNFLYCGNTGTTTFYQDETGRLRHPRQNGVNISRSRAVELGWVPVKRLSKYRYVLFTPDNKRHLKIMKKLFLLSSQEYP